MLGHLGHHVELHGHGDDVEADHGGDGEVKVLRGDHLVDDEAGGAVVHVVRTLHHLCKQEGDKSTSNFLEKNENAELLAQNKKFKTWMTFHEHLIIVFIQCDLKT